jgi:hypothetical protein
MKVKFGSRRRRQIPVNSIRGPKRRGQPNAVTTGIDYEARVIWRNEPQSDSNVGLGLRQTANAPPSGTWRPLKRVMQNRARPGHGRRWNAFGISSTLLGQAVIRAGFTDDLEY